MSDRKFAVEKQADFTGKLLTLVMMKHFPGQTITFDEADVERMTTLYAEEGGPTIVWASIGRSLRIELTSLKKARAQADLHMADEKGSA